MQKAPATALNHSVWCRAPNEAELPGLRPALVHPPPRVQGAAFPREESPLPAMGTPAVPKPREQSWDQSIKESAAGGETAESRGALELSWQPRLSPQHWPWLYPLEGADPHATPLHSSHLEACNNSEAVESTGLISHQCPSDAGRKGCELRSQWTVGGRKEGGRKEGGRKGGRGDLGGLAMCRWIALARGW